MAIDLCSENSGLVMSPARISFSHDLSHCDVVPVEQRRLRSGSSSGVDFDFCVHESSDQSSSCADELFSDGKILPTHQIKKTASIPQKQPEPPSPWTCENREFEETKGGISEIDEKQGANSKSFWRFKRSSSLNCGSGYAPSLCPLPLLSRSNSTGSSTKSSSKDHHHHQQQQQHHNVQKQNLQKNSSKSSGNYQKPPLKKNYGAYGNGVRINTVLNVPSGNLFGLGSIFNVKEKSKRKMNQ
ncbi:uncharacterized protein LOC130773960 [Actinidia eriantha]|uniref:uncharacterized protein LOC130773960 n=1 Tax=Actinidia eriantha TaxID=165200 RepID=UPI00258AA7A1|nr:uncharacterized protein LOC130773960 [Actinidia eriantha]